MKDHIILLVPRESGNFSNFRHALRGMRDHMNPMEFNKLQPEAPDIWERQEAWTCNEADVNLVVDFMTRNFPGRDIAVSKLTAIHTRPAGELQSKTVSKNGILPE